MIKIDMIKNVWETAQENFGFLAFGCIPVTLKTFEGWKFFEALNIFEG